MLFNTFCTLGLATLAIAAPQRHSIFGRDLAVEEPAGPVERGLVWEPRNLEGRDKKDGKKNNKNKDKNDKNDKITITQLLEVVLTVEQHGKEVELAELIEEKIKDKKENKKDKDKVRKNHFKNKNGDVDTVIIVVTQVEDERDSNNKNTRYVSRQIHSNKKNAKKQMVIVSEKAPITVGSNASSKVRRDVATGTGFIAQAVATYNPSSPATISNATLILPSGVPAPSFSGTPVSQDPAGILDDDSTAFVDFGATS